MSHFTLLFLTLVLALSGSCGIEPVTQKSHWSLKLTTSGGFAGVGNGNLSVDSKGQITYESPSTLARVRKGCSGTLYKERFNPINDAVARTNPKEWNDPGLKVAAPDAFGYKLELRIGAEPSTTVQWYDNTRDKLPDDLRRLSEVLLQQMERECYSGDPKSGKPE
jgi:hypothetical protein